MRDLRFAVRTLFRAPGFTLVTVSLARARDRRDDGHLQHRQRRALEAAALRRAGSPRSSPGASDVRTAGAGRRCRSEEFRAQSAAFERFSGYELTTRLLETGAGSERVTAVVADREFFTVLGVEPIAGRTFDDGDPPSVAVLGEALWTRQFDRDPSIVGRTMALSGNRWDAAQRRSVIVRQELTVIGVMPERFQFPYRASSVFPGRVAGIADGLVDCQTSRRAGAGQVIARLKPGVSVRSAEQELELIERRLDVTAPGRYRATGVQLTRAGRRSPRRRAPVAVAAVWRGRRWCSRRRARTSPTCSWRGPRRARTRS